jgi:hypothetical protein
MLTTHRWESGGGSEEKLAQPERHVESIEVIGPDTYRSRRQTGEVVQMHRCPQID